MATRFYLRRSTTWPKAIAENGGYQDMTIVQGSSGTPINGLVSGSILPDNSRQLTKGIFYSERFTQQFTLSGLITVNMRTNTFSPSLPLRGRYKISKVTTGGSMVETPILSMDMASDIVSGSSTDNRATGTPPNPVVIAPGERLVLRVYLFPSGGTWGTFNTAAWQYDASGSLNGVTWIEITETVTTRVNGTKLYLRRTTANGIGSFMDLLTTIGSTAATTAIVNTVASATEKQWTKTAGGALAEWISPRFNAGWSTDTVNSIAARVTALESSASANCTVRMRAFRRQPDGTETQCGQWDYTVELSTTAIWVPNTVPGAVMTSLTPMAFNEDDRIVVRFYIIPAPSTTMGGGFTCTLQYDHNVANAVGESWITIEDAADFKLETDPARSFTVPGGLSELGIGNGQ